jgi:hypothetical protein
VKVTAGNFGNVAQNAKAAVLNEQVTRQRVELLEAALIGFVTMNRWKRLRWAILGLDVRLARPVVEE